MKNFLRLSWIIIGVLWCQGMVGQDYIKEGNGYALTAMPNNWFISSFSIPRKNNSLYIHKINKLLSNQYIQTLTIGRYIGTTQGTSVGGIVENAFDNCTAISTFLVSSNNQYYSANDGVLFNKTYSTLLFYPVAKAVTEYEIPTTVTSIATSAKLNNKITSLIFKGGTMPALNSTNFLNNVNKANCTLTVTYDLYDKFIKSPYWSVINNIVCIKEENGQTQIKFSQAGNLSKYLNSQQNTLTNLKITGPLNGTDIAFLRTLTNTKKLAILDLSDASIVAGGGTYYDNYETQNDIFPQYAFVYCPILKTISLPTSVKEIGAGAFEGASNITEVIMTGCSFEKIGFGAFFRAEGITKFNLPSSVTDIDPYAFTETWANTGYTIDNAKYKSNNGVIYTDNETQLFLYPIASANSSVTISKNITKINTESGLTLATQLEKIVVERDNKNFSANNGILYSSDFTTLLTYPLAKKDTEYEIPATVTEIASYVVFSENLTSITYKENKAPKATAGSPLFSKIDKTKCMLYVSKAAYESFKNTSPWNTLTNIIRYDATPEDLATKITLTSAGTLETQIGNKKFTTTHLILTGPLNGKDINCLREMAGSNANATVSGKGQLAYLDIKNTTIVQSDDIYLNQGIGNTGNSADKKEAQKTTNNLFPHYAFYKCPTLQTIILPTSVTAIGNSALRACDNLSKVDMTDCEFTSIDHNAFRSSKKIATFNLPVSLETIANDAFVETTVNKEFKLQSSSNWFEVQEGVLFSKDKKNLVAFPAGKNITEYTVPFGTERIVSCAFSFSALKTLSMPYGLIYLEPWAFEGTNFASLTLPATVTEIGRGVFLGCGSVEHLYIHNPTPPAVSDKEGQELDKINCILHVPYQKKDTYKKANYWSEFTKIEELSDVIYVYTAGTLKSTLRNMGIEPSELSSIMVHGFLNGNDIKYLRELAGVDSIGQPILNTKLKSINIGQATIQAGGDPYLTLNRTSYTTSENNLGKYAFANTGLEAFHFPANIAAVEANIFTACRDLNYIVFETLPGGMNINDVKSLLDESQPNGIIAINSNNPGNNSNIANVVFANDKNATVELTDKFNYVSHVKLSLESCTFTKHFSKATKDGETRGWETIILPFKPTEIRGYNRRGVEAFLVPFNENEKDEAEFDGQGLLVLNFWLRKLTPTGFVDVTFHEIEPNTPYIISMPNSPKDYNNTYNIQGDVQFIAYAPTESSIELNETTELKTIAGETFDMAATFKNRTDIKDAYVLNAEGTSFDLISTITQKQDTINAFEAYATAHPAYKGVRSLSINQRPNIPSGLRDIMMNGADGEEKEFIIKKAANGIRIVSNVNKAIQIHSIEGRLIAKEYIYEGENFVALPKGIYLIERQKVVVY